jgi:hypothetical protein
MLTRFWRCEIDISEEFVHCLDLVRSPKAELVSFFTGPPDRVKSPVAMLKQTN